MQKGTATHAVVEETKAKHEKATTLVAGVQQETLGA